MAWEGAADVPIDNKAKEFLNAHNHWGIRAFENGGTISLLFAQMQHVQSIFLWSAEV